MSPEISNLRRTCIGRWDAQKQRIPCCCLSYDDEHATDLGLPRKELPCIILLHALLRLMLLHACHVVVPIRGFGSINDVG